MAGPLSLAGRVRELQAVTELLSGTSEAAAMLVMGEAGVGKSRLIATGVEAASRADVMVLTGWCLPLSEGLPFLPVVDLLRVLGLADEGRLLADALAACPPFVGTEVGHLLPEREDAGDEPGSGAADEGWRKGRLFEAVRRLFGELAGRRALAVVIEDMHWADRSTLELLDYFLVPGHALGVPMALTCRTDDEPTKRLSAWLEALQRNRRVRRLELAPLTELETTDQIELLLGTRPPRSYVAETYARSEGNPFFTEQLVAADTTTEDHALPAGLTSLLLSRTGQVAAIARELLAVLAVAARPLDEPTLALLCQRPAHEVREDLRDLLARQLLHHPGAAGRYQLRHALLAEAISSELLPSERAELHARIADTMIGWDDPNLAAQIAEHLAAAGRPAEELPWRVRAGRQADAVYASSEAAHHWQRAVALSADAPIANLVQGMSLAQIYRAAEDALMTSGSEEAARELTAQALQRLAGADPVSRADVLARAGQPRSLTEPQEGLDLLYQALAIYEQLGPSANHAKVLRDIYLALVLQGRLAEAADVIGPAALVAERAGDRPLHIEILGDQAWGQVLVGAGELGADRLAALRRRLTGDDEPRLHLYLALLETDLLLKLGRLEEVEKAGAAALQIASAHGIEQSRVAGSVRGNMASALIELGAIEDAARWIDAVTDAKPELATRVAYAYRAILEMLRGDLDGAYQRCVDLDRLPPDFLYNQLDVLPEELELHVWRGSAEVAFERSHTLLVRTVETSQGRPSGPPLLFAGQGPLLVLALRACADLAERARATADDDALTAARRRADQLFDLYRAIEPDPFTPGPLRATAVANNALWQAERSRLRGASDSALWEQAADAWDAVSRPNRAAYARWRQAEALLGHRGDRAAAVQALQAAARQAGHHVPLSNAIHELARRARINLNPSAAAGQPEQPAPRAFELTERELAVLRLVAAGHTNAQIGAELFISPKTAGVHVTNILRKFGVATRVQAAAVAERAGLLRD